MRVEFSRCLFQGWDPENHTIKTSRRRSGQKCKLAHGVPAFRLANCKLGSTGCEKARYCLLVVGPLGHTLARRNPRSRLGFARRCAKISGSSASVIRAWQATSTRSSKSRVLENTTYALTNLVFPSGGWSCFRARAALENHRSHSILFMPRASAATWNLFRATRGSFLRSIGPARVRSHQRA